MPISEQQWYQKQFGVRAGLWACIMAASIIVMVKTHSFGWYFVTALLGVVIRFAPLACRLDGLDHKYKEESVHEPCRVEADDHR